MQPPGRADSEPEGTKLNEGHEARDAGIGSGQSDPMLPFGAAPAPRRAVDRMLRSPLLHLALYYLALLAVAALLIREFPVVHRALVTPTIPALTEGEALLRGVSQDQLPDAQPATGERALTALLVVLGAIALAIPVAWIYMVTKRLRFDPALVRSVVILPIAVAGILLVVKHSLAIAFSLAGIVAAVRFRNTLKDPRDAVYVFLTIAIGVAAGVQALDVALVVSFVFNVAVFTLWKLQVGSLQAGSYGRTGVLSIGDPALLVGRGPDASEAVRRRFVEEADGLKVDGILLVHTVDPEVTRHAVQEVLRQNADDWRSLGAVPRGGQLSTAQYLVELDKKSEPADLLGALDEWSSRIAAAEFIPFHGRRRSRAPKDRAEEDDDD
jgi:hypothetical protein